jgi:hypothetical protein
LEAAAADDFVDMSGVARDPPHDRRKILSPFHFKAFDEIGTVVGIKSGVVAIVPFPDPAAREIDQFVHTCDCGAGGWLGETVFALTQNGCARGQTRSTGLLWDGAGASSDESAISRGLEGIPR